jgi:hypothetical protein
VKVSNGAARRAIFTACRRRSASTRATAGFHHAPEIEKRFRGIGKGWARFVYGGSTGGWEAMAVQMFYPDEYNGAWIACPDPIDFRAYTVINIYEHENAYYAGSPWKHMPRPGKRWRVSGIISSTRRRLSSGS